MIYSLLGLIFLELYFSMIGFTKASILRCSTFPLIEGPAKELAPFNRGSGGRFFAEADQ